MLHSKTYISNYSVLPKICITVQLNITCAFNDFVIAMYSIINQTALDSYLISLLNLFTDNWITVMVDGIHNEPNEPEQGHKQDEHGQVPVDYSHRTKTNQALAQNMDSVTGLHSMNYDGKCMTEVNFSHDNE